MTLKFNIIFLFLLHLTFVACNKEESTLNETGAQQINIAPCTLIEKVYLIDSIYYTGYTESKFNVRFSDTATGILAHFIDFGFNRIPTTGMYQIVSEIDTNSSAITNQISFITIIQGSPYLSANTDSAMVYVENNSEELIISYCDIPHQWYSFDVNYNCYVGNGEGYLMYKKKY